MQSDPQFVGMTSGLAARALDCSERGRGFKSHQLLPRKGFLQSLWFAFQQEKALGCLLPNPAPMTFVHHNYIYTPAAVYARKARGTHHVINLYTVKNGSLL